VVNDSSAQSISEREIDSGRSPTKDELDELRHLLLEPEQTQIVKLQKRLDDPRFSVDDVSRALPEAITLRSSKDSQLSNALMPAVENALTVSVKRNPQKLVDIIFPVLGPSIRKAISSALGEMVQSINQTLEHSLSFESLKWRLEAYRTGKPFGEIVLYHKMVYQVEHAFLIHKQTGLQLLHVARDTRAAQDADLISAMLTAIKTAIQDFVHDSFGGSSEDVLKNFVVGERNVWVEQTTHAIVAAVIKGEPTEEYRRILEDAALSIQREHYDELEAFEGDTAPFVAARVHLKDCLRQQLRTKKKTSPLLWIIPLLLISGAGVWLFFTIRDNWRWSDYVERLKASPGIIVVSDEKRGGKHFISGLRDPLAIEPASLFSESRIDPEDVVSRWEPYQAIYPEFVLIRAERLLQPPRGVTLRFENNTLYASGIAPRGWIAEARRLAPAVPGVDQFQEADLRDESELEAIIREIESIIIVFATGSAEITPDQNERMERVASGMRKLGEFFPSTGKSMRVEISGFADKTGTDEMNMKLSQERADQALSALASKGIKPEGVTAKGMGVMTASSVQASGQEMQSFRTVTFRVIIPGFTTGN
jgi:OOP family OmpA-OmpF porin